MFSICWIYSSQTQRPWGANFCRTFVSSILLFLDPVNSNFTTIYFAHLRTTVPFVTVHLEIFHCTHYPVIPKSDLYFTFCSTFKHFLKEHQSNC